MSDARADLDGRATIGVEHGSKPLTSIAEIDARPLRILVVADSKIAVPPAGYGGAERIIAHLCEGFARRGHKVTLMAARGSKNYGRLVTYPWAGRRPAVWRAYCKLNFFARSMIEIVRGHDVVVAHCRADYVRPFLESGAPVVYHFHNPIAGQDVDWLLETARGPLTLVSVSDHQRRAFAEGHWATIYNAVDVGALAFSAKPAGDYLAFLGRLTANKGVDTAIEVARRTGLPLKIAGNISDEEGGRAFFEQRVRPHLAGNIEWIGEIGDAAKSVFLGGAKALLAPIRWDEPFGLCAPEALACGTPVIACVRGAMPELIRNRSNGILVDNADEMTKAVFEIDTISRQACRQDAEDRFSTSVMVEKYLAVIRGMTTGQDIAGRSLSLQPSAT
jgi:glycosyltransferase involved in cell wall biosynthesis